LGLLVAGSLLFWLVLAYPARLLGGDAAVVFSGVAALLCLVPTAATLAWAGRALRNAPEQQLAAVMGGTAVRLVVAGAAGMAVYHLIADFHQQSFWLWVIVFYPVTLTLEMSLLLGRHLPADAPKTTDKAA